MEDGKISYATNDGYIYRSSRSLGKSTSSLTGKVISRGGFGSRGRAMGVSS